ELVSVPEAGSEPLHARGTIGIHRRSQPNRPGVVQQQAKFRVVVGVVVGDEDVAQRRKRKLGLNQLEAHAVAGVDYIGGAVVDDEIGGWTRRVTAANGRTAFRAEQHQTVGPEVRRGLLRGWVGVKHRRYYCSKPSALSASCTLGRAATRST